jgi:facilitated trehalose transporter
VIFYATDIFESAGSSMDTNLQSIIIGIIQVVATLTSVFIVDRLGRRILLLFSDIVMCISLVCLGIYFKLKEEGKADDIGWLPLVTLMIFVSDN